MSDAAQQLHAAQEVILALGFPRAQQNERSALCLLALLDLPPGRPWAKAANPLLGITPIMDWARAHYGKEYAPNTRETVRRQTMHQFVAAGLAVLNPDQPGRPVNSPGTTYQMEPSALALLRRRGARGWRDALASYLSGRPSLAATYARARTQERVPVRIASGMEITLSPGSHSVLIQAVISDFGERFAQGSTLIYVGDTGDKWGYFDAPALEALGVTVDAHGKMPDVVLHDTRRNWLLLVEAVTSHGPVDGKRHGELSRLFARSTAGLVFVSAFPDRATMNRFLATIAWETEAWVADAPSHMIHFDGERFLGPYPAG